LGPVCPFAEKVNKNFFFHSNIYLLAFFITFLLHATLRKVVISALQKKKKVSLSD
jgi:hypothetical protein